MKRYRVIYAPGFVDELDTIGRYIGSRASPEIARDYVERILRRCDALEHFPERGTPRDDIRPGLRTIAHERRVIIAYQVFEDRVEILGVSYGGRLSTVR